MIQQSRQKYNERLGLTTMYVLPRSALAVRDHCRLKYVSAKNEEFTAFLPSLIVPTNYCLCYGTINAMILINSSIRLRTTVNPVHVPLRSVGMPRYNEGDRHVLA
ncbi:hypothetical protein DPV78_008933 [Talaromyces pinophilus]|nr:hypothetical protein DPV78_008933 [Talaromyces pinophilus]